MERELKVDWLAFTTYRPLAEVVSLFGYLDQPLIPYERGLNGYHLSFRSESGVKVLYSGGRRDVHVIISGVGCSCDLITLLGLVEKGDKITRLDIALDCLNSGYTCADIWGYLQQGRYVGRFKPESINQITGVVRSSGYSIGIGSRSSGRYVRIYDKGAEQGTGVDWLRIEVQINGDMATRFFRRYAHRSSLYQAVASLRLINQHVRLVQDTGARCAKYKEQKNHKLLKTAPIWKKLVGHKLKTLSLHVPRKKSSVASALRYVKQASASMRALKLCLPDFDTWLTDVVENASLRPKHHQMIDEYMNP